MRAASITAVVTIAITMLHAEDFSLTKNGVGPLTVHTSLTYEGKGERLIATATNDSGLPIPYLKLCVTAATKGCLFEMWNTARWEPGATLNWNMVGNRRVPNLSHEVIIETLNVEGADPSPSPAIPSAAGSVTLGQPPSSPIASTAPGAATGAKPIPIPQGVTLCLQPMAGSFDAFLIGEMEKQKVPVTIVATVPNQNDQNKPGACDPSKSSYTMTGDVIPEGKSFSARSVFGLRLHLRDEIQGAVKLVRNSDNTVVWAGDSDRGEVKKVAEHIVNQMLKQRPIWVLSPITR